MLYRIVEMFPNLHSGSRPQLRQKKLHILACDINSSDESFLYQLREEILSWIKSIPQYDALFVGVFSSYGVYEWIVSSVLEDDADYQQASKAILAAFHDQRTTLFSEVLDASLNVLRLYEHDYAITTFTLICNAAVISKHVNKEYANIRKIAKNLYRQVVHGTIIAYGPYVDLACVSMMAKNTGCEIVTTGNVEDIAKSFHYAVNSHKITRREVTVDKKIDFAFELGKDGHVYHVNPSKSEIFISNGSSVYRTGERAVSYFVREQSEPIEYAYALALLQGNRMEDLVSTLTNLGDVYLSNLAYCATTHQELWKIEKLLREALCSPRGRFLRGRMNNYLPPDEMFDFFTLMNILVRDEECYLLTNQKTLNTNNYLDGAVSFTHTVSDPIFLDMSLQLPDKNGLYPIIKNARIQHQHFSVILGDKARYVFEKNGLIPKAASFVDTITAVIDFSVIPTCNRARIADACNWQKLADLTLQSMRIDAFLAILREKWRVLSQGVGKEENLPEVFSPRMYGKAIPQKTAQQKWGEPVKVKTFEIWAENADPICIEDMQEMIEGKKKWNTTGELMCDALQKINKDIPTDPGDALRWVYGKTQEYTHILRSATIDINIRRIVVGISNQWKYHFDREEAWIMSQEGKRVRMRFRERDVEQ